MLKIALSFNNTVHALTPSPNDVVLHVLLQAELFEQGKGCLQQEFKTLLARHGRPVPPVIILDMLGQDDGKSGRRTVFQWIVMKRLSTIFHNCRLVCHISDNR